MKIEWRLPHRALPARLRASRRGAVAPILALMLPALLGTVAFSVDLAGLLRDNQDKNFRQSG